MKKHTLNFKNLSESEDDTSSDCPIKMNLHTLKDNLPFPDNNLDLKYSEEKRKVLVMYWMMYWDSREKYSVSKRLYSEKNEVYSLLYSWYMSKIIRNCY